MSNPLYTVSMKPLYTINGTVIAGKKRGRDLGFPTANIALREPVPSGIYFSFTNIADTKYPSLTFIGDAKTFGETLFQAETYILDFTDDMYGKKMTVHLLEKIRDNEKFTSPQALIEQMQDDEKKARVYFTSIENPQKSSSFNELSD